MSKLRLHNYYRSTTSFRVRIALNMKGLDYDYADYPLLPNAHKSESYMILNPQGLVPALEIMGESPSDFHILSQSLAILEYIDETHPSPPLLPNDPLERARIRSLAQIIACDIHPLGNLRVLRYLTDHFNADKAVKKHWFQNWAKQGFEALETRLSTEAQTGQFCHGDSPSLADICLYAQIYNNERWGMDPNPYPVIMGIYRRCHDIVAFQMARPENQPDAPQDT